MITATPTIPNISKLLYDHLIAKNKAEGERPVAGSMTWRASKLGSCLRAQYLEFYLKRPFLEEFDALSLRRFEVGHQWGRTFEEWFLEMGFGVRLEQELFDPALDIGGHADFILTGGLDVKLGVELKSVNSKWFWYRAREKETTASPEHMMQAAVYSLLTGNEFPWIVLTVSKDDLTIEQDVVTDEHRRLARERINILNAVKRPGVLPPPCTCKDDWQWKYCPYYAGDRKAAKQKGAKPDGECCVV